MNTCCICGDGVTEIFHIHGEEYYCDACFYQNYNYCCQCSEVITQTEEYNDHDGLPYCSHCYDREFSDDFENDDDEDYDYDCPDNPAVSDFDRELVVTLSRKWLSGKVDTSSRISINKKDFYLLSLKEKTGLLKKHIYCYGLKDREDYQVTASKNIFEPVEAFFREHSGNIIVTEGAGVNRIGLSFTLRKEQLPLIIQMLTSIAG